MKVFLDGLEFPEGLRWREGRLWFSDMNSGWVVAADVHGRSERVVEVPGGPSGLGWLPDGRMLVVSMRSRRLLRLDGDRLDTVADLSPFVRHPCNDMVVDREGRAYVGNFGFDVRGGEAPKPTVLLRVDPDGGVHVAADDVVFPNGGVLTPDGGTLLLAETFASCITAFTVVADGSLTERRVWAPLPGKTPDGIALDNAGGLWVASPHSGEVLRVEAGGRITDILRPGRDPFACALGEGGRVLFVATSRRGMTPEESRRGRYGAILCQEL